MNEILQRAKDFLNVRKRAYEFTFNIESVDAKMVLKDLAKFCRADETCFHENDRAHAVLEGRREVWLRIQKHLNLSSEELWELYRKD